MQSANCASTRQLKICWWMALLSLWGYTGMEKGQMDEAQKRNMFIYIKTKKMSVYIKQVNWLKDNCLLKLKQNGWWRGR